MFPLPVLVEILLNGTWTDITSFAYIRDGVTITGGRVDENSTPSPATVTLTLNNTDGRFSPNYTGGAYYPYLVRNTQLRLSVQNATSSSGNTYTGYRFWGKVADWPPQSDVTGIDVFCQITASGPFRQLNQGGGKGSALTRYYGTLTGQQAPIAYWPCEEGLLSSAMGAGLSSSTLITGVLSGGSAMTVTQGKPTWKAIVFNGSAPVPVINRSTWDGLTGSFGASGNDVYNTPGTYTWVASTTTVDCRCTGSGAGGGNGQNGGAQRIAGGAAEFAREATLAVTPGNSYTFTVPAGGQGGVGGYGLGESPGQDGAAMVFAGDAVTVTANGGKGGRATSFSNGAGGTGSANTNHFNGGIGARTTGGTSAGGAGGGSSGGTASAGHNGSANSGSTGGAGGTAVAGGGAGGRGGNTGNNAAQAQPGSTGATPGGGGGSGGTNLGTNWKDIGGNGGPGQLQLVYTPPAGPPVAVMRFVLNVPAHSGQDNGELIRFYLGGSGTNPIDQVRVIYGKGSGGRLKLQGYNATPALLFDSGFTSFSADGNTLLVSIELVPSGSGVNWKLTAIKTDTTTPRAYTVATVSGTQASSTLGNVSECTVGNNGDITKTSISHISVQYALIDLRTVYRALNGHDQEMGIDRFIRLANEQALDNEIKWRETQDHWGFETGTQSWVGTNCSLGITTNVITAPVAAYQLYTAWPPEGVQALLITASGAGQPSASSPTGTSGQWVLGARTNTSNDGDVVSVAAEVFAPTLRNNLYIGLAWYNGAGTFLSQSNSSDTVVVAGEIATLQVSYSAPYQAQYFAVVVGNHAVDASGILLYVDNVRFHAQMGPQTRKEYKEFLEEIEDLDQGILEEAKDGYGLKYRTRISLINQSPAVTLDYSQNDISLPFLPQFDDQKIKNDITAHRHKGSRVRVSLDGSGNMSTQMIGRYRKTLKVIAHDDAQLAALAAHLLNLGTVQDERYPTITVDLTRAALAGTHIATLMSAVASVEPGDYVQVTNLPFWLPTSTTKQIVLGYTEVLGADSGGNWMWTITWNCAPESPYELTITSLRRW